MKVSLASLFISLTTWQALASVTDLLDKTNPDVHHQSRRRKLRKLDQFEFLSESPSMASIEQTADPTAAPGNDDDTVGETLPPSLVSRGDDDAGGAAGTKPPSGEGSDEEDVPTEGGEGDDEELFVGDDTPSEVPKEETSPTLDVDESPAESPSVDANESPASDIDESPTTEGADDDDTESPSFSPFNSTTEGGVDDESESPSLPPTNGVADVGEDEEGESPSPSPTHERTEIPTAGRPSYGYVPTLYPTRSAGYPFSQVPPTSKPYVSNDDEGDPILGPSSGAAGGGSGSGSYEWENSTVDEMEHDETVIIALSVVFGVMFLFSVIVAHQMLENPNGHCARYVYGSAIMRHVA
jgi:hypothetical protein